MPDDLRARLAAAGLRPSRRLGQNFLRDGNLARFIVRAGGVEPGDAVLEVGPGMGQLTLLLAQAGARVLAVEVDRGLAALARGHLAAFPDVTVQEGDILSGKRGLDPKAMDALARMARTRPGAALRCVSNLPYSAGTPFVMNLLSSPLPWTRGVFLLQWEVARRMAAAPGGPDYGSLSIGCALAGRVSILRKVPPSVFWPPPKVDSAVVQLDFLPMEDRLRLPWRGLARVTGAIFGARRKNLRNALKGVFAGGSPLPALEEAGLPPDGRGEGLAPGRFAALARIQGREA